MYEVDVRLSDPLDGLHQIGQFACKFLAQRQKSRGRCGMDGGAIACRLFLLLLLLLLHG